MRRLLGVAALLAASAPAPRPDARRGADARAEARLSRRAPEGRPARATPSSSAASTRPAACRIRAVVWTTHEQLVEPTLTAVQAWVFRPALENGQPDRHRRQHRFPFPRATTTRARPRDSFPAPRSRSSRSSPPTRRERRARPRVSRSRRASTRGCASRPSIDLPPVDVGAQGRRARRRRLAVGPQVHRLRRFDDRPRQGHGDQGRRSARRSARRGRTASGCCDSRSTRRAPEWDSSGSRPIPTASTSRRR